jgi:predicted RNase H-like nuclease
MDVLRGVDGCSAGWLCLSIRPGEIQPTASVFDADARALLAEPALVTAIDIPIGLPCDGSRSVDRKARGLLGPLKSSVFPAPVRATLDAASYLAACEASHLTCGKKLSRQTYAILPRIQAVDALLRDEPGLRTSVYEVHPEVCFVYWNGERPLCHPKTSGFGFVERLNLVKSVFGSAAEEIRRTVHRREASDDDILDAFAALWTAQRIHAGCAVRIVDSDDRDEFGLPMQMWA